MLWKTFEGTAQAAQETEFGRSMDASGAGPDAKGRRRRRCIARGIVVAAALASPAAVGVMLGQSYVPATVTTASTTLYTATSQLSPGRIAVDRAGNVFYVAVSGSSSTLMEIPAAAQTGGSSTPVTLITGLGEYNSKAAVVDANGNLWASTGNQEQENSTDYIDLVEIPAANGIPNTSLVTGGISLATADLNHCTSGGTKVCTVPNYLLNDSGGVINGPQVLDFSIDGSGNITYLDIGDNNLPSGMARVVKSNVYSGNGSILATITQDYSGQVAVDGAGNTYYCSPTAGKVYVVTGGALGNTIGTTATIGSAVITSPNGISSDIFGNLYISGSTQLSEVPFEGTALNFADEYGIANATSLTNGISNGGALDQNGNFYYDDNASAGTLIQKLQVNNFNFGKVPVGTLVSASSTPSAPALAIYDNVATLGVSSYFPTGSPLTNTTSLYLQSFPYASKSFSSGTAFAPETSYTITMDFQPVHPGLLVGSYTPRNNGIDIGAVYLQGTGVGPEPLFFPGTPSQLFTTAGTKTLNAPQGLALDSYGDIFVADTGNGTVDADCLASTVIVEDGTGGTAGNNSSGTANSFCATSTYSGAVTALGTGFVSPVAVAVDGTQSLYVLDSAATGTPVTVINGQGLTSTKLISAATTFGGTALSGPMGLALDGYNNIYIADTGNNRIVEAHQIGFGTTATDDIVAVPATTTFGGTKLSGPQGIAVDASQNLYIADTGNNRIVEYSGTGAASVVSTGPITLSSPYAVAVYPSGQLVVTDKGNGVVLVSGASSSVLSFGTAYTTTAAKGVALDASGNIYVANTSGDQVLQLSVTSNSTLGSQQTINFPSTNLGSSSIDVTETVDNAGNAALVDTALATSNANFTIDSTSGCTASSTTSAGSTCSLVLRFTPQITGSAGPLTASATLTDNQLSYTLNTSTTNETGTFGTSGTQALNLAGTATSAGAPQTITFAPLASPIQYTTTPIALSATATSGLPVTFTVVSGPGTISGSALTVTGAGTIVVAANQLGNSSYSVAPTVQQSIFVNQASQTITFQPVTPVTYETTTPISLTATSTSGLAVTFTLVSGPATLSGSSLTITGIGKVVVSATQAGNTDYLAATPVQATIVVNPIGTVATPVFSMAGGSYNAQYVTALTISESTPGATVYYTTDGSTPTTSSPVYTPTVAVSGIKLTGTETVEAIAVLPGYTTSATASATYTIITGTEGLTETLSPTSLSLQPGASGTINITVTPQNGINATLSFACTGLPIGATCSFSPNTVATGPAQGPVSTVLTVTAPTTLSAVGHGRTDSYFAGLSLAALALLFGWRKRRGMPITLLVVMLAFVIGMSSGCGGSNNAQTSTITVAISGDAVRLTPTFTLTVQ